MSESQGISITNQCYDCMQLDTLCVNCQDLADARSAQIAHDLVDEGNLQYRRPWLLTTEPSGHDWVSSTTVSRVTLDDEGNEIDHVMREEYKLPVVMLSDGGVYEELWELDDYRQGMREVQCPWCNLLTPKHFNDCQDCDKPLELNVR
jgi:hypothetical protein